MPKWFKKIEKAVKKAVHDVDRVVDKATRDLDSSVSKAAGMPEGVKIGHALNPDSVHHKEAVKHFKGQAAPSEDGPIEEVAAFAPATIEELELAALSLLEVAQAAASSAQASATPFDSERADGFGEKRSLALASSAAAPAPSDDPTPATAPVQSSSDPDTEKVAELAAAIALSNEQQPTLPEAHEVLPPAPDLTVTGDQLAQAALLGHFGGYL